MGVYDIIPFRQEHSNGFYDHQEIQQDLGPGRADTHMLDHLDFPDSVDPDIREFNILADVIGNEIDMVTQG